MTAVDLKMEARTSVGAEAGFRAQGIDSMRFLAIIAIICIHANNYSKLGEALSVVCRFAVPFFFVTAGYYFRSRPDRTIGAEALRIGRRILVPYLVWLAFYLVFFRYDLTDLADPRTAAMLLVDGGPAYHLWFLPSLAVCSFLLVLLDRVAGRRAVVAVAVVLYLLGLALGPYSDFLLGAAQTEWNPRNGPLFGLPFMVMGYALRGARFDRRTLLAGLALFALGAVLSLGEVLAIKATGEKISYDLLAGTVPLGLGAFLAAISLPPSGATAALGRLGRYSLGMFAVHVAVLSTVTALVPNTTFAQELLVIAVTAVVTTLLALALGQIRPLRPLIV